MAVDTGSTTVLVATIVETEVVNIVCRVDAVSDYVVLTVTGMFAVEVAEITEVTFLVVVGV